MTYPTYRQPEILRELSKHHGGINLQELADRLKMVKATLCDHIRPLRDSGKVVRIRAPGCQHLWCLPEFEDGIRAEATAVFTKTREAYRRRQNERYKRRRAELYQERKENPVEEFEGDPVPVRRRVIPAAEAPALVVRAPNSVWQLGAML